MQRLLCLQLHEAKRAGTHIDIRFESYGETDTYDEKRPSTNEPRSTLEEDRVLKSFAIPKARLPELDEKLLCIPTEDHPWDYKDFEGVITGGYGAGPVKLLYSDNVEVSAFTEKKITFLYDDKLYTMFDFPKSKGWLITQKKRDLALEKFQKMRREKDSK